MPALKGRFISCLLEKKGGDLCPGETGGQMRKTRAREEKRLSGLKRTSTTIRTQREGVKFLKRLAKKKKASLRVIKISDELSKNSYQRSLKGPKKKSS